MSESNQNLDASDAGWHVVDGTRDEVLAEARRLGLTVKSVDRRECWVDFRDGWSFACARGKSAGFREIVYDWDGRWRLCVHPATYRIHTNVMAH